jgi:hypothetical protein
VARQLSVKAEAMRASKACEILNSAFINEFAVPGKHFNAAAFDAKVNKGNAKFPAGNRG